MRICLRMERHAITGL